MAAQTPANVLGGAQRRTNFTVAPQEMAPNEIRYYILKLRATGQRPRAVLCWDGVNRGSLKTEFDANLGHI